MTVDQLGGKWFVTCADCGVNGPVTFSSATARGSAKRAGWSRCYRGRGEQFRCPGCRAGDAPLGAPAELVARALLYAAGSDAGGTDIESFDDDERAQMVATARGLVDRAVAHMGGLHA